MCRQTEVPQAEKQVLSLDALLLWADVKEAPDAWKEIERLRERWKGRKSERERVRLRGKRVGKRRYATDAIESDGQCRKVTRGTER